MEAMGADSDERESGGGAGSNALPGSEGAGGGEDGSADSEGIDGGRSPVDAGGTGGSGADEKAAPAALIDLEFVRGLIAAIEESSIDSLEISRSGTRIRISKSGPRNAGPGTNAVPPYYGMPPIAYVEPSPSANAGHGAASSPEKAFVAEQAAVDADLLGVKSPMVGTFYRAPAPEAPPYVEVGTRVAKGQTLCILEAMKLMNELTSEVDGVVREILVENAEPVEYGQLLFRIDTSGG